MSLFHSDLDTLNCVFYLLELTTNIVIVPLCLALCYSLTGRRCIHPNFRAFVILVLFGQLVQVVQRMYIIAARLFFIGNANPNSMVLLSHLTVAAGLLSVVAGAALVGERAVATVCPSRYEKSCRTYCPAFCSVICIIFFCLVLALRLFQVLPIDAVLVYLYVFFTVFTVIGVFLVYHYNRSAYRRRHYEDKKLGEKYQIDENIRATGMVLPFLIVTLISKLVIVGLMCYSVWFTDKPLGQDTSHLSHAYDVSNSSFRLLGMVLLATCGALNCFRKKKSSVDVLDTQFHFGQLAQMWN